MLALNIQKCIYHIFLLLLHINYASPYYSHTDESLCRTAKWQNSPYLEHVFLALGQHKNLAEGRTNLRNSLRILGATKANFEQNVLISTFTESKEKNSILPIPHLC
jgi:hypothetical protein